MKDVLTNKAAQIQRCINRVHEDYDNAKNDFNDNFTVQDAVILNIQRACEASIDMATYICKEKKLGIPESSRDAFTMLVNAKIIPSDLAEELKKMVSFRNLAIHNYTEINLEIVRAIIEHKLEE